MTSMAAYSTNLGLTNQARVDMLMNQLLAGGKKRLVANWEVFPQADGTYEVCFTIDSIARKQVAERPKARAAGEGPFGNPGARRPKSNGVRLSWVVDPVKKTCVANDDRTRALQALQPRLSSEGLDQVLPATWRVGVVAPPAAPVTLPPPISNEPDPPAPAVEAETPQQPAQFSGFVGSDGERKAIIQQGGQHLTLGLGDRFGAYKVKSVAGDELVLEREGETLRLIPGQTL